MIPSPLNYTGGKYRLLPQITPLFPKDVSTFVDLFCGGCNVGINADSRRVIYNDINRDLLSIYGVFKTLGRECLLDSIYGIIERYGLSLTSRYGYSHYGCDSGSGLAGYNPNAAGAGLFKQRFHYMPPRSSEAIISQRMPICSRLCFSVQARSSTLSMPL